MTVLVLYEELAGYFISCISFFSGEYNADFHVIHKAVNPEAPFVFKNTERIHFYNRENYTDLQLNALVRSVNPDSVFCGGWSNKSYLKICNKYSKKIPVVLAFDNKWTGTLRQRVGVLAAPFTLKRCFNRSFVPGSPQKEFALKIGFRDQDIRTGAYSCDQSFFSAVYSKTRIAKAAHFPHRFIFTGRYVEAKGIKLLWEAFVECITEARSDWELWCLGTGPLQPFIHPSIRHVGFIQPQDLPVWMEQTGVFILPSIFEPWGVALHEFASAGFPLICSDQVGASESFMRNNSNGFCFPADNKEHLKSCMKKIMSLPDSSLVEMGRQSNELSKQITLASWSSTLLELFSPF